MSGPSGQAASDMVRQLCLGRGGRNLQTLCFYLLQGPTFLIIYVAKNDAKISGGGKKKNKPP